ncbi:hypothetical protein JJJA_0064 [Achromobacter phage JWDelta]|uniref:Uncharacterized protein n=2 Tax=Jwalphavirus jwalpha TaxID=2169963 RepID=V9VF97_9CAUD|nr:hypothetical protein CH29_gp67 [Achromobacter phage JWAlpha]AHC56580.1 hypothetical protein JJJA_0064 [Achromobacter phage JWDelta]AHC94020.1 hypothetical protein JJJB_0067 [Achromobacter phage JWAlpha]
MTPAKLLMYLVSALIAFLLLSAWVHASAPYIAAFIIVVIVWKFILPKETNDPDGDPPGKQ